MWISGLMWRELKEDLSRERSLAHQWQVEAQVAKAAEKALEVQLATTKATLEWFKHRTTQIEQERAQLIYAATGGHGAFRGASDGVKIATPNFVGEPRVSDVLNHQNNPFGDTGEDSRDLADQMPGHIEDVSGMPNRG